MSRDHCDLDGSTQRKQWTQFEDETVRRLVLLHGTRSWTVVAQHLPGRTGKQCRERWHNHLDHDIRKDAWSIEEDRMLLELHGKVLQPQGGRCLALNSIFTSLVSA